MSKTASNARFGKVDNGAFWRGADAGERIGIDPQAASEAPKAKIGRSK